MDECVESVENCGEQAFWGTVDGGPRVGVVENGPECPRTRERPPHQQVRRASECVWPGCYRQRVVMRKPMNMMPKPIRMFHDPSDGTGSVVFEM